MITRKEEYLFWDHRCSALHLSNHIKHFSHTHGRDTLCSLGILLIFLIIIELPLLRTAILLLSFCCCLLHQCKSLLFSVSSFTTKIFSTGILFLMKYCKVIPTLCKISDKRDCCVPHLQGIRTQDF